jgi:hypothetical protein
MAKKPTKKKAAVKGRSFDMEAAPHPRYAKYRPPTKEDRSGKGPKPHEIPGGPASEGWPIGLGDSGGNHETAGSERALAEIAARGKHPKTSFKGALRGKTNPAP